MCAKGCRKEYVIVDNIFDGTGRHKDEEFQKATIIQFAIEPEPETQCVRLERGFVLPEMDLLDWFPFVACVCVFVAAAAVVVFVVVHDAKRPSTGIPAGNARGMRWTIWSIGFTTKEFIIMPIGEWLDRTASQKREQSWQEQLWEVFFLGDIVRSTCQDRMSSLALALRR